MQTEHNTMHLRRVSPQPAPRKKWRNHPHQNRWKPPRNQEWSLEHLLQHQFPQELVNEGRESKTRSWECETCWKSSNSRFSERRKEELQVHGVLRRGRGRHCHWRELQRSICWEEEDGNQPLQIQTEIEKERERERISISRVCKVLFWLLQPLFSITLVGQKCRFGEHCVYSAVCTLRWERERRERELAVRDGLKARPHNT